MWILLYLELCCKPKCYDAFITLHPKTDWPSIDWLSLVADRSPTVWTPDADLRLLLWIRFTSTTPIYAFATNLTDEFQRYRLIKAKSSLLFKRCALPFFLWPEGFQSFQSRGPQSRPMCPPTCYSPSLDTHPSYPFPPRNHTNSEPVSSKISIFSSFSLNLPLKIVPMGRRHCITLSRRCTCR